jgi:hypothetical protein
MEVPTLAGFDVATAVRRRGGDGARASYDADLDPDWRIGTKPNGGYLLAVLARAALHASAHAEVAHPHPIAVSAHFLAAPDAGPMQVDVEMLRIGRSASQLRASLLADGRRCVEALVTCGRLPAGAEPWWSDLPVPPFPPEESCVLAPHDTPAFPVPLLKVVQERLDPATAGFAAGRPSGRGEIRGWVRLADGRAPDPLALLVAADCLPPATFELGLTGSWVPTMELTVYVRAVPAAGALRARLRARMVGADRVDEQCDVWDSSDHLVATGHQLAAIRLPEGRPSG